MQVVIDILKQLNEDSLLLALWHGVPLNDCTFDLLGEPVLHQCAHNSEKEALFQMLFIFEVRQIELYQPVVLELWQ